MRPSLSFARWAIVATALASSFGAFPTRAWAEDAPAAAKPADEVEDDPEAGTPRPGAKDERTGHIVLAPRIGLAVPVGNVASTTYPTGLTFPIPISQLANQGPSFGGVLGVGVSRHVLVEASGSYTMLGSPLFCPTCSARMTDLGLGLSYHLAQGVALDPWASFSTGFRQETFVTLSTTSTRETHVTEKYWGVDIARLTLGADFYPLPSLGIGPYFETDIGTNVWFPDKTQVGSTYAFFQIGVRLALDPRRIFDKPAVRTGQASAPRAAE